MGREKIHKSSESAAPTDKEWKALLAVKSKAWEI